MQIHGFQKLTLLDFPGRTACTLFTGGCNFRCPFCHNALLVTKIDEGGVYDEAEIFAYLNKRVGLLDGVAITGGEPTLQKDLPEFIKKIKDLGYAVKLDTNGTNPTMLKDLVNRGLVDYVAMDVKNCKEKYAVTSGLECVNLKNIEESMLFLLEKKIPFEFRTTVVEEFHTVEDIEKIAEWISGCDRYFLQMFKDGEQNITVGLHAPSKEIMEKMRDGARRFVPNTELRGVD